MICGAPLARAQQELRTGVPLESALAALSARGHRLVYSSALVTPAMKLRASPRSTDIGALLAEILSPWQLRAVQAANGDWLIVPATPLLGTPVETVSTDTEELETIDVTASRYALATPGASRVFLDRRGVEQMPHLADDAVRMLKVLPGVSGGDFSAALNVRGGRREETRLRIDGAEIHGGFHFRDLDGALSVLDTNLVESIDFVTGGMTAQQGSHLSGLVDMRTRRPRADDEYRSAAGVSFVSAYGRTGGTFAEGRGAWLASARRGYLDVIMERVQDDDEQITPRYTDVFTSLYYDFGEHASLAAHAMLGEDDLRLVSHTDDDIDSAGQGRAAHFWMTLDQRAGAFSGNTVLSTSSVRQWRKAAGADEQRTGDVDAIFRFRFLDLRSDWNWRVSERQELRFGGSAGRADADYDYALVASINDPGAPGGMVDISHAHEVHARGSQWGAHGAWRGRAGRLVVEAGMRHDAYRYSQGLEFSATSPRLNAVYTLGERGELRAAWGVADQAQGLDELQVEDGLTTWSRPERVRQSVLGYLHRFGEGFSARIELYRKDYSHLRPRFENALDPLQLIPEGAVDRVRIDAPVARARGVELTVRREAERGFAGWVSVAVARAEEDVANEGWIPRLWDQRRSLSTGLSWSGARWSVNLAGLYHSGTPTTRLDQAVINSAGQPLDVIVAGPRNRDRLGDYARVDLRARRSVELRAARLSWYLEVTNLLDRENACCKQSYYLQPVDGARPRLVIEESSWLPLLPSFGFQFEF